MDSKPIFGDCVKKRQQLGDYRIYPSSKFKYIPFTSSVVKVNDAKKCQQAFLAPLPGKVDKLFEELHIQPLERSLDSILDRSIFSTVDR